MIYKKWILVFNLVFLISVDHSEAEALGVPTHSAHCFPVPELFSLSQGGSPWGSV